MDKIALPANAGNSTCSSQVKMPHTQFTCVTCTVPVEAGIYTCFYAAKTSRRMHAIGPNKARKLQVTSPAGCRITYLQVAGEFTRDVIASYLQLQVFLCGLAVIFACGCAGIFSCVCSYFCLRLAGIFLRAILIFSRAICMYFCLQKQAILHASRGQFCMNSVCKIISTIPVVLR